MFRKSVQENSAEYKKKAIAAFDTARDFFGIAYIGMLLSLSAVLAGINLAMGIVGGAIFILAWTYIVLKNHPYQIIKKEEKTKSA